MRGIQLRNRAGIESQFALGYKELRSREAVDFPRLNRTNTFLLKDAKFFAKCETFRTCLWYNWANGQKKGVWP